MQVKWAVTVVTPPAYEPCSLLEMRRWSRIEEDDTAHDPVLRILRQAMREYAENLTLRDYIPRTRKLYLDDWPRHLQYGVKICLPHAPLISVDSFKYVDRDGNLQTLATDQYSVHSSHTPGFIIPAWHVVWPTIRLVPDAVQITFQSGYSPGSPPDEAGHQAMIPESVRLWMQARAATLFENREQLISGTIVNALPRDFVDGLLDSLVLGERLF